MKKRCVIVAGGNCDLNCFDKLLASDYIIAADSGLKHLISVNMMPDLIVGDFDSYSGEIPIGAELIKLPVQKDDTDLLFAARCGVSRGFKSFLILGGYGSRPDQNFAMYSTMQWIYRNAAASSVIAQCIDFKVQYIENSSVDISVDENSYLSVFPFGGAADGVDVIGAQYELHDAVLTSDFPIGVSNEASNSVQVSVKNGGLLIMTVNKNI